MRDDNVRRGYDRVEDSIGRSYDEIKGVTMSVSSYESCVKLLEGKEDYEDFGQFYTRKRDLERTSKF